MISFLSLNVEIKICLCRRGIEIVSKFSVSNADSIVKVEDL